MVISCFLDLLNSEKTGVETICLIDCYRKDGFTESEAWFRAYYML